MKKAEFFPKEEFVKTKINIKDKEGSVLFPKGTTGKIEARDDDDSLKYWVIFKGSKDSTLIDEKDLEKIASHDINEVICENCGEGTSYSRLIEGTGTCPKCKKMLDEHGKIIQEKPDKQMKWKNLDTKHQKMWLDSGYTKEQYESSEGLKLKVPYEWFINSSLSKQSANKDITFDSSPSAWFRIWIDQGELEYDKEVEKIIKNSDSDDKKIEKIKERAKEIANENLSKLNSSIMEEGLGINLYDFSVGEISMDRISWEELLHPELEEEAINLFPGTMVKTSDDKKFYDVIKKEGNHLYLSESDNSQIKRNINLKTDNLSLKLISAENMQIDSDEEIDAKKSKAKFILLKSLNKSFPIENLVDLFFDISEKTGILPESVMDIYDQLLTNGRILEENGKSIIKGAGLNKNSDILPGGAGDEIPDSYFEDEQLKIGILHEMEHTNDRNIAKEIAKDHLIEDPEYYLKQHVASLNVSSKLSKRKDGWHVYSEKGKHIGGPYKNKSQAKKRLRQIEMFKHIKKSELEEIENFIIRTAKTKEEADKLRKMAETDELEISKRPSGINLSEIPGTLSYQLGEKIKDMDGKTLEQIKTIIKDAVNESKVSNITRRKVELSLSKIYSLDQIYKYVTNLIEKGAGRSEKEMMPEINIRTSSIEEEIESEEYSLDKDITETIKDGEELYGYIKNVFEENIPSKFSNLLQNIQELKSYKNKEKFIGRSKLIRMLDETNDMIDNIIESGVLK